MFLIRSLKILLLLGLAGLVYGIGFSLSTNSRHSSEARSADLNGSGGDLLAQRAVKVDILRTRRGLPTLQMQASESRTFVDGRLELNDVLFQVHGARGARTLVEAPSAVSLPSAESEESRAGAMNIQGAIGSWMLQGGVTLTGSDGLTLTTPTLAYFEADGQARTSDAFDFRRGKASGRAVGLTYEVGREVVRFRKHVTAAMEAGSLGRVRMEADTGTYFIGPGSLEMLDYHVSTDRGETLDGSRLEVFFRESGGVERLEGSQGFVLSSSHSVASADGSPLSKLLALEGARTMRGDRLTVLLDPKSEPTSIEVTGDASLAAVGVGGSRQPTRIAARTLQFHITNGSLASAQAVGTVDLQGAPQKGKTSGLRLLSDNLEARFDPNLGSVLSLAGEGEIRLSDDGIESQGHRTTLDPNSEVWTVSGEGETPATTTWLSRTIQGPVIVLDRRNETLTARGGVRTSYTPTERKPAHGEPGSLPFFSSAESIYAMSEALTFSEQGLVASYRDRVRIWQGDNRLEAHKVDLNERLGTLEASGEVISTFRQPSPAGGTPGANLSDQIVNVSAEAMRYLRQKDRITYERHVVVNHGATRLSADTVVVVLAPGGGQAERMEADGSVEMRDQGRVGSGDRLVVDLLKDTVTLSGRGREASVQDVSSQQVVRGNALTIDRSSDRILVESELGGRTWITLKPRQKGAPVASDPQN